MMNDDGDPGTGYSQVLYGRSIVGVCLYPCRKLRVEQPKTSPVCQTCVGDSFSSLFAGAVYAKGSKLNFSGFTYFSENSAQDGSGGELSLSQCLLT